MTAVSASLPVFLFALTFGACRQNGSNTPVAYGDNAASGHFLNTRGIRLYYETYGEGTPLLLLHINGGSIANFANQIPYFATRYHVIAVDTRAHGKSTDPADSLTFEQMADDFNALLDSLHLDSCYVIGWSDGGIDALLLAIRHPDKVIRLASTGANLWPTADAFRPGLWDDEKKEYNAGLHKTYTTAKEKNDRKLFLLDWNEPHITLAQLHTIKAPSLIICGDHDLISITHTVLIYQNIPHAQLWVVPNSGHATLQDQTDDFNR
jgi:pimeloyl-ACP methyl ester carboxylesterase